MGKNYYANYNHCQCCNRSDSIHIGKGWDFCFQVGSVRMNNEDIELDTYAKWMHFLSQPNITIFDENDEEYTIDQFKAIVIPYQLHQRKFLEQNPSHPVGRQFWQEAIKSMYVDADGYLFSKEPFE